MKNDSPEKDGKRLLARLRRTEEAEVSEEARDEAQVLLLARHLERLRSKHPQP